MHVLDGSILPSRAGVALLIGAVLGAALVSLGMLGPMLISVISWRGAMIYLPSALMMGVLVFGAAFAVFACGLFVLAAPAWWVLHRLGLRRWLYAVGLGVLLSFGTGLALTVLPTILPHPGSTFSSADNGGWIVRNSKMTTHGWHNALESAALISIAGGIVGLAVWALAYRWDPLSGKHCC